MRAGRFCHCEHVHVEGHAHVEAAYAHVEAAGAHGCGLLQQAQASHKILRYRVVTVNTPSNYERKSSPARSLANLLDATDGRAIRQRSTSEVGGLAAYAAASRRMQCIAQSERMGACCCGVACAH